MVKLFIILIAENLRSESNNQHELATIITIIWAFWLLQLACNYVSVKFIAVFYRFITIIHLCTMLNSLYCIIKNCSR